MTTDALLCFRDFVPKVNGRRTRFFLPEDTYQSLEDLLSEVNQWVSASAVEVINVETVVLADFSEDGSAAGHQRANHPNLVSRFQIIRVWYRSR